MAALILKFLLIYSLCLVSCFGQNLKELTKEIKVKLNSEKTFWDRAEIVAYQNYILRDYFLKNKNKSQAYLNIKKDLIKCQTIFLKAYGLSWKQVAPFEIAFRRNQFNSSSEYESFQESFVGENNLRAFYKIENYSLKDIFNSQFTCPSQLAQSGEGLSKAISNFALLKKKKFLRDYIKDGEALYDIYPHLFKKAFESIGETPPWSKYNDEGCHENWWRNGFSGSKRNKFLKCLDFDDFSIIRIMRLSKSNDDSIFEADDLVKGPKGLKLSYLNYLKLSYYFIKDRSSNPESQSLYEEIKKHIRQSKEPYLVYLENRILKTDKEIKKEIYTKYSLSDFQANPSLFYFGDNSLFMLGVYSKFLNFKKEFSFFMPFSVNYLPMSRKFYNDLIKAYPSLELFFSFKSIKDSSPAFVSIFENLEKLKETIYRSRLISRREKASLLRGFFYVEAKEGLLDSLFEKVGRRTIKKDTYVRDFRNNLLKVISLHSLNHDKKLLGPRRFYNYKLFKYFYPRDFVFLPTQSNSRLRNGNILPYDVYDNLRGLVKTEEDVKLLVILIRDWIKMDLTTSNIILGKNLLKNLSPKTQLKYASLYGSYFKYSIGKSIIGSKKDITKFLGEKSNEKLLSIIKRWSRNFQQCNKHDEEILGFIKSRGLVKSFRRGKRFACVSKKFLQSNYELLSHFNLAVDCRNCTHLDLRKLLSKTEEVVFSDLPRDLSGIDEPTFKKILKTNHFFLSHSYLKSLELFQQEALARRVARAVNESPFELSLATTSFLRVFKGFDISVNITPIELFSTNEKGYRTLRKDAGKKIAEYYTRKNCFLIRGRNVFDILPYNKKRDEKKCADKIVELSKRGLLKCFENERFNLGVWISPDKFKSLYSNNCIGAFEENVSRFSKDKIHFPLDLKECSLEKRGVFNCKDYRGESTKVFFKRGKTISRVVPRYRAVVTFLRGGTEGFKIIDWINFWDRFEISNDELKFKEVGRFYYTPQGSLKEDYGIYKLFIEKRSLNDDINYLFSEANPPTGVRSSNDSFIHINFEGGATLKTLDFSHIQERSIDFKKKSIKFPIVEKNKSAFGDINTTIRSYQLLCLHDFNGKKVKSIKLNNILLKNGKPIVLKCKDIRKDNHGICGVEYVQSGVPLISFRTNVGADNVLYNFSTKKKCFETVSRIFNVKKKQECFSYDNSFRGVLSMRVYWMDKGKNLTYRPFNSKCL